MSFDLSIENYNKDDLENLLSLQSPYTKQDIVSQCNILKTNLNENSENIELDSKIQEFLNLANQKLCSFLVDNNQSLSVVTYADTPNVMKGTINPLYKRRIYKILNIDTRFRTHYNELSTDFKFDLPMKFKNIYEMSLKSIEFSQSLQNIFKSSKLETNKNDFCYILTSDTYTSYNDHMKILQDEFNYFLNNNRNCNITDEFICDLKKSNTKLKTTPINNLINGVKKYSKFEKVQFKPHKTLDSLDSSISGQILNCDESNSKNYTYLFNNDIEHLSNLNSNSNSHNYKFEKDPNLKYSYKYIGSGDSHLISFGYDNYLDYDDENRELIDCLFKNEYISDNTPLQLKLGWLLGYRKKLYKYVGSHTGSEFNNIPGITDITGNLVPNIISPEAFFTGNSNNYLYLALDDFNNNVSDGYYSAFNSSILNKNILSRISLSTIGNNLVTSFTQIPRTYFGPVNLEKMHIQLLDELGKPVYLQNMDFSFALNLTEIYN